MERRIFVDVETPNFANDRICGIALWVMEGRNVIHAINQKIDPEAPFDARFVALHGIDAKAVAFEPNFAEFWPHIEPLIDGALWVAHHALFDLSVIQRTLQAYHIESAVFPYICTLNHARRILPDLDRFTLPAICHHFGIELSHPHDPFNDLAACNAIYRSFESCAETAFKPIEIAFVLPQDLKDSKEGASLVLLIDELLGWIDGFLTEAVIIFCFQRIGLINEQYAADGFLDFGLNFDGGLPKISRDEISPGNLYQLAFAQIA